MIRPNDESPSGQGRGFQETNQSTNGCIIALAEKKGNPAYLIAELAKAGHAVVRGVAGDFTVTRWGMSRYCENLESLQAFGERVGVRS